MENTDTTKSATTEKEEKAEKAEKVEKTTKMQKVGKAVSYGVTFGVEKVIEIIMGVFNAFFAKLASILMVFVTGPLAIVSLIGVIIIGLLIWLGVKE